MGRNFDITCYYCGDNPHYRQLIGIIGWGPGGLRFTKLSCKRCGFGEYIPTNLRVVSEVLA